VIRLPAIRGAQVMALLKAKGFREKRRRGSHIFFAYPDGRTVVVPVHKGEDLGRGILSKILNDAEVSRTELIEWLHKGGS